MRSFLGSRSNSGGQEYFDKHAAVTRADIAGFLYILHDVDSSGNEIVITDIDGADNSDVIRKVVGAGLMDAANGIFDPKGTMSCAEFIAFLDSLEGKT